MSVVDVVQIIEPARRAERMTPESMRCTRTLIPPSRLPLRPVFCPRCRTHYTMVLRGPRAPTVMHVVCAACGGDGRPGEYGGTER